MKKRILRYFKHIFLTFFIIVPILFLFGILTFGAGIHYDDNPKKMDWNNDGPYAFYKNDSIINLKYIKGNKEDGYYVEQKDYPINELIPANSTFALDSTQFSFTIKNEFTIPQSTYNDSYTILAISDIEGGYKTFRDFLINNHVIDKDLNWTFGKGHLVLVGDFVDRGFSVTQVLWFIYKLEQNAKKSGGNVHFIIGNHELKNMYGNYKSASEKYNYVSSMLSKTQNNLYDSNSVLGNWLVSKNAIESINGNLFAHGGLHPNIANLNMSLEEINSFLRANYYTAPYPKPNKKTTDILLSSKDGICWYRGYFRDDLTQEEINKPLDKFNAKTIVVGHTLQSKVNRQYDGRVIGIDVAHPKDYQKYWPKRASEGLLIEGDKYFRVLSNGEKEEI